MKYIILQDLFYLIVLVTLSIPLGIYIYKVMSGQEVFISKLLTPFETLIYRFLGVKKDEDMTGKKYAVSVMSFSIIGILFVWVLQLMQNVLPFNAENLKGTSWHLAFNTAVSFVTNTNWQAYSGESTLSYLTQFLGLTVQNFVSAATGIAVVFALIRGFIN